MLPFLYRLLLVGLGLLVGYALPWRLFDDDEHRLAWSPKILLLPLSVPLLPFLVASRNRRAHPVQARLIEWLFGVLYALVGLVVLILLTSD